MLTGMPSVPGRVAIAGRVARSADLRERAGLPLRLRTGRLHPGPGLRIEEDRLRRLAELASVTAEPVGRRGRRVEYRMLNGVRREQDAHLEGLDLRYELTAMLGRPIGWEAAKTAGHVHVRPPGSAIGYPEIVEVLHGEAGFLVADLSVGPDGPRSVQAWLVRAGPGERVILPPDLAHVTLVLGAGPLVFSDVIDRSAAGVYTGVAAARGFGWYVGADGRLRPNRRYPEPPDLAEVTARDWNGPGPERDGPAARRPLYVRFREDPDSLAWLSLPERFPAIAPALWARVATARSSSGRERLTPRGADGNMWDPGDGVV
jgi:glucose-6-phosphate isomerase, archaeal